MYIYVPKMFVSLCIYVNLNNICICIFPYRISPQQSLMQDETLTRNHDMAL